MVPTIDGKMHHFTNAGLYDALFVMQDTETKTLWNHITGEGLYGPLVGRDLGPLSNLLQMTVRQALEMDRGMRVAISDRLYFAAGRQFGTARAFGPGRGAGPPRGEGRGPGGARARGTGPGPDNPNAQLGAIFVPTLGKEDPRRPRMDMGLGVWTGNTRRYYPMERIRERGEALLDTINGRRVVVYVDPETYSPAALFVEASRATIHGKDLRLDNGRVVRSGMLIDRGGQRRPLERPQQIFTRWYGFALTFPGCEVFGAD